MRRVEVKSSLAVSIGHGCSLNDPTKLALEVETVKGGLYQYEGVELNQYMAIMQAESVGRALLAIMNARLDGKPVYPCYRIVTRDGMTKAVASGK